MLQDFTVSGIHVFDLVYTVCYQPTVKKDMSLKTQCKKKHENYMTLL